MILIVDAGYKKDSLGVSEFVLPVVRIAERTDKCMVLHYKEVTYATVMKYDKVIICGTALKDNGFMDDISEFDWIRTCGKSILGICAGMEIIGAVFGSRLVKCQEIGMYLIKTVSENQLFESEFEAYGLHNHAVEPSGEFSVIARSQKCPQGIKHKKYEIYGVMFHPEVRNPKIIERFLLPGA